MLPKTASARWLTAAAVGVAAIALASVVIALAGSGDPPLLPAGTPEGTVQRYILGIDRGDFDEAYALLDEQVQDACPLETFRSDAMFRQDSDMRVRLEEVREQESGTHVTVRISSFSGRPLFDLSENSYSVRFLTREVDGDWRIVEAPWPFPSCGFIPQRPAAPPPEGTPSADKPSSVES